MSLTSLEWAKVTLVAHTCTQQGTIQITQTFREQHRYVTQIFRDKTENPYIQGIILLSRKFIEQYRSVRYSGNNTDM
jgi:hypothetical protein